MPHTRLVRFAFLALSLCAVLAAFALPSPVKRQEVLSPQEIQALQGNPFYRDYIRRTYGVAELSEKNQVDGEALTDAIIEGLHSDRFSPFSQVPEQQEPS